MTTPTVLPDVLPELDKLKLQQIEKQPMTDSPSDEAHPSSRDSTSHSDDPEITERSTKADWTEEGANPVYIRLTCPENYDSGVVGNTSIHSSGSKSDLGAVEQAYKDKYNDSFTK